MNYFPRFWVKIQQVVGLNIKVKKNAFFVTFFYEVTFGLDSVSINTNRASLTWILGALSFLKYPQKHPF